MAISDIFNKYKMLDRKVGHSESHHFPTCIFLNPCHRCRLAKLFDCQGIAGDKEAATVTRKGCYADKNASDHRVGCLPSQRGASPI